jgi:hypothetical protein
MRVVGHPLDVLFAHLAFQKPLGVADPIQAKVADIGFGRDEGHRHAVAHLGAAECGFEDEQELIGRAEAACALRRADDDRAGVGDQLVEDSLRRFGMVDVADGLGVAVGAEALDFVKGKLGPGCDHKVVVGDGLAIDQKDAVFLGHQLFGGDGDEVDPLLRHRGGKVHRDVLAVAPADGDPGVGGHEVVLRVLGDDGHPVFGPQLVLHFVGHDGPA